MLRSLNEKVPLIMKIALSSALTLLLAAVFIFADYKKRYKLAAALKLAASGMFTVTGILSSAAASEPVMARMVVSGLFFGALADELHALRFVFEKARKALFIIGTLVFLAGHVFYIIAIIRLTWKPLLCICTGTVLSTVVICIMNKILSLTPALKAAGFSYAVIITVMLTTAAANAFASPCRFTTDFAIGAVLFFTSDIILVLNSSGKRRTPAGRTANLGLYYMAQTLIAASLRLL